MRQARDKTITADAEINTIGAKSMEFSIPISVVMSTYNTEIKMLQQAVESILSQTFREFEFLIIDDGSTDESADYLNSLQDERIRLIRNPVNIGLTKSLNIGLKAAMGKYIARMDSDDIALPQRFEKQYAYMEAHPDVILCGTRVSFFDIDPSLPVGTSQAVSSDMEEYRILMLFRNPGPYHPTAFFRHETLLEHHVMYDESLVYAQDYGMWETISHLGQVYILKDILLYYRRHEKQISIEHKEKQFQCDKEVKRRQLNALLGNVTEEELELHFVHSSTYYPRAVINPEIADWYARLLKANKKKHIYRHRKLKLRIQKVKIRLVYKAVHFMELSKAEKMRLYLRYIPLLYLPAVIVKFHIMDKRG